MADTFRAERVNVTNLLTALSARRGCNLKVLGAEDFCKGLGCGFSGQAQKVCRGQDKVTFRHCGAGRPPWRHCPMALLGFRWQNPRGRPRPDCGQVRAAAQAGVDVPTGSDTPLVRVDVPTGSDTLPMQHRARENMRVVWGPREMASDNFNECVVDPCACQWRCQLHSLSTFYALDSNCLRTLT